jgi:DNA polymerase I-like protein with 3'-5' exonuclease and polymerase domains
MDLGFRYYFSEFDDFLAYEEINKKINWDAYKIGKNISEAIKKAKEIKKEYIITDKISYNYYQNNKKNVSSYYKLKSAYLRTCLNYPAQTKASFQTKLSLIKLFNYIKKNNHIDKVLIINSVYDENVLEVPNELVFEYEQVLKESMIEAGNYFLTNNVVKMDCDAYGHISWGHGKKAKTFWHLNKDNKINKKL